MDSASRTRPGLKPEDPLHIYHLSGRVRHREEAGLGPGFVGNWVEGDESFLFFTRPADRAVRALGERPGGPVVQDRFEMPYGQWQASGSDTFQAAGFTFVLPWAPQAAEPSGGDPSRIFLDPGVVFGAGNHPTTRHVLDALEAAFRDDPPETVLDLGTGTGVLALAAARLGAGSVTAVDLNFLAAKTALANARQNGLDHLISVACGRAEDFVGASADLIVANIHFAVMEKLIESPGFLEAGSVVISGLLRSEYREITARLARKSMIVLRMWDKDQTWFTALCQRRA